MLGVSDAEAVIVGIDITPISGPNAGLADNSYTTFSILGGSMFVYNNLDGAPFVAERFGLGGQSNFQIRMIDAGWYASPRNFAAGYQIGPAIPGNPAYWTNDGRFTLFQNRFYGAPPFYGYGTYVSPDFGPGSYLGFRVESGLNQYNYGWIEATWDSTTSTFQILSAAYESEINTAIAGGAGPGPEPIPEPGTWAAAALLAGGATFLRWRRRRDAAQKVAA